MSSTAPMSADLRVEPVRSARERRRFVEYVRALYQGCPAFVPPLTGMVLKQLDERKNPFFAHAEQGLFLAWRNGRICGRIAAILDRDLQARHARAVGVFGFFDCEDDPRVAAALLQRAAAWHAERGVDVLLGPIQHSTNYEAGLLVEGFEHQPAVMMTYNHPYYAGLLEPLGFHKAMDLLAYDVSQGMLELDRLRRIAERAERRSGVVLRSLDLRRFDQEVAALREVYNGAWEENWGFVPLREEEFRAQADELRAIVRPELLVIAEKDGQPVAFAMCLPDVNRALAQVDGRLFPFGWLRLPFLLKRLHRIRVVTLGVLPDFRGLGLDVAMICRIIDQGIGLGFDEAELSWMLESNQGMIRPIEALGARLTKRYRLYEAPLSAVLAASASR